MEHILSKGWCKKGVMKPGDVTLLIRIPVYHAKSPSFGPQNSINGMAAPQTLALGRYRQKDQVFTVIHSTWET